MTAPIDPPGVAAAMRKPASADLFSKVRGCSPDASKKPRTYRTGLVG